MDDEAGSVWVEKHAWLAGEAYACSSGLSWRGSWRGDIISCIVAVMLASCLLMSAFSASAASLATKAAWSSLLWSEFLRWSMTASSCEILDFVFSRIARWATRSVDSVSPR